MLAKVPLLPPSTTAELYKAARVTVAKLLDNTPHWVIYGVFKGWKDLGP